MSQTDLCDTKANLLFNVIQAFLQALQVSLAWALSRNPFQGNASSWRLPHGQSAATQKLACLREIPGVFLGRTALVADLAENNGTAYLAADLYAQTRANKFERAGRKTCSTPAQQTYNCIACR